MSFFNVVIWRMPQHQSAFRGRSFCPICHHTLGWLDLIPVVSYVCLKGKCRYCGHSIPRRDTIMEIVGGVFALYCVWRYSFTWDALLVFLLFALCVLISSIDFMTMEIPDAFIIALVCLVLVMSLYHLELSLLQRCIGFFSCSLPMYLCTILVADCFGGGDIKFIAVAGFLLGWQRSVLATCIAVLLGGSYATYLFVTKKANVHSHIPFGPYLCSGVLLAFLYGTSILYWYIQWLS